MRMTESSRDGMNSLAAMCFNANAIIDNLAYSLDYHYYTNVADMVHHNVAHIMPEWADLITNKMLELGARPVRKDINGYEEDYEELARIFEKLSNTLLDIRNATRSLIEAADMDGDDEVRIFGEDFLNNQVSKFIKQADEWLDASKKLTPMDMNIHIKDYTHFIAF